MALFNFPSSSLFGLSVQMQEPLDITIRVTPIEPTSPVTPERTVITVEEIHETFFTEVDRLLADAKVLNSLQSDKQALLDKADRLSKLGFYSAKEVKESYGELSRLRDLEYANLKKEHLKEAIEYFSRQYPTYKFITEDSVKKICAKYGLIYGDVSYFIGTVPEKNLKHIEDFKVIEKDECYQRIIDYNNKYVSHKIIDSFFNKEKHDKMNSSEDVDYGGLSHKSVSNEKCPLEIAAPASDFDLTRMEVRDFQIVNAPVLDPVVLYPVHFNGKKHYLIVTAWGDEASDELVINPIHN